MQRSIPVPEPVLVDLLEHASSAARLAGCIDDPSDGALAVGLLSDDIDAIVHTIAELLGTPHMIAVPVPNALSSFGSDVVTRDAVIRLNGVPELVLDAPDASRTVLDHLPRRLTRGPAPAEPALTLIDDESTRPHVRQLRRAYGRQPQHPVRLHRPPHVRQHQRIEKLPTTRRIEQVGDRSETPWVRPALVAAVIVLLGMIVLLMLGACGCATAAVSIRGTTSQLTTPNAELATEAL